MTRASLLIAAAALLAACGDDAVCPSTQTECDNFCANTDSDPNHCGACGNSCGAGEVCAAGACAVSCPSGLTDCGGACVDSDHDPDHCGGCDVACAATESCVMGSCESVEPPSECPTGQLECDGTCTNPMVDPANCGATGACSGGTACADNQACAGGECVDIAACNEPSSPSAAAVSVTAPTAALIEGGDAGAVGLVLDSEPCGNVFITLTPDSQLTAGSVMVVFTPTDWDQTQNVEVQAVHDFDIEGDHTGAISMVLASDDSSYNELSVDDASIDIADRAHVTHVTVPADGVGTNGLSNLPAVSNDGRYVSFLSEASNLVTGDAAGHADVFLRDLENGTTQRISYGDDEEADGLSNGLSMSADGSVIAFRSVATNLVTNPITGSGEVYRWDATNGISLVSGPCTSCNNEISAGLSVSGNGEFVAYTTRRRMLTSDTENEYDVYVYEVADGTLTHESLNSADENGTAFWGSNSFGPKLSMDGTFVTFHSAAQNLATPDISTQNFHAYVKNRTSRALTRVSLNDGGTDNCNGTHRSTGTQPPQVSMDGNIAVFGSACPIALNSDEPAVTNGVRNVFVRDIAAETTTRISLSHDGMELDGATALRGISGDGRYVLMTSDATNFVADDTNGARDAFLHDRMTGTTTRVSYDGEYGELANGVPSAGTPVALSWNGQFVVFATTNSLAATDGNVDTVDLYLVQLR